MMLQVKYLSSKKKIHFRYKYFNLWYSLYLNYNWIYQMNVSICTLNVRFDNFGHNTIIVYKCRHYWKHKQIQNVMFQYDLLFQIKHWYLHSLPWRKVVKETLASLQFLFQTVNDQPVASEKVSLQPSDVSQECDVFDSKSLPWTESEKNSDQWCRSVILQFTLGCLDSTSTL